MSLGTMRRYWQLLRRYLAPQRYKVLLLAVLLVAVLILQLAGPQILGRFIDGVTRDANPQTLIVTAVLFVGAALLGQALFAPAAYLTESIAWTATNALRSDLTLHCLQLDMRFHHGRTPGEMMERVDGDIAEMANFFSQFLIQIVSNVVLLSGVLALLFVEDWRFGVALTGYVLLATVVLLRFQGGAVPHFAAYRQAVSAMTGFWEEALTAREDVRANGAEPYLMRRNVQLLRAGLRLGRRANMMFRAFVGAIAAVFVFGTAVAFVVGAYLNSIGAATIGTIFMVLSYTMLLSENLRRITDQIGDLQRAGGSIERVYELQRTVSHVEDGRGDPLPPGPLSVTTDGLAFGYNADRKVLDELSISLPAGQTLGVLGRTGSGKSTLARLLFRFYDPDRGHIALSDVDIRHARMGELRRRVGLVTQDVQLFHASLRDNVTLFDPRTPDDRIIETFGQLGLGPWYERLPDGLDTMLEGAGGLSGGEAQLLAFARVFVTDPDLVVLDEASSRLDAATELAIERAVDLLLTGRTAIIIAHRLSSVRRCDQILVLEHGRVQEYGPYEDLARAPGSRLRALLDASEGMRQP